MKAVLQRAKDAKVTVEGETIGQIDKGYVILLGVHTEDTEEDVQYLVNKIVHLRIFEDEAGKMNRSLMDVSGSVLSVSQFTLYADTRKGRRPSFVQAANPDEANRLYEMFNDQLRTFGILVETGKFGAMMDVQLTNDGPVTIIIDSRDK